MRKLLESLNSKWLTRDWDFKKPEHIELLFEVEQYMTDFDFWTTHSAGKIIKSLDDLHLWEERIYALFYNNVLQYVGISHCFSRRMGQHYNASGKHDSLHDKKNIKTIDEIKFFQLPDKSEWPEPTFNLKIEREMMDRYRLNRNEYGEYTGQTQLNFIRTENNYKDSITEQLSLF